MPVTIAPPDIETKSKRPPGAGGGGFDGAGWGGDDPNKWGPGRFENPPGTHLLGMWLALASIVMLFVALSSAYVFRLGLSSEWRGVAIPPFLLPNTLVLFISSLTLELGRKSLRRGLEGTFQRWLTVTASLGIAFLAGQIWIWKALAAQGVYLNTNPHSAFFYLLTGAHGVHLFGGVTALCCILVQAWIGKYGAGGKRTALDVMALYWHFMDGLWIYLVLLLFVWRS